MKNDAKMSGTQARKEHRFQHPRLATGYNGAGYVKHRRLWAMAVPAAVTLALGGVFLGRASLWTDEIATWISSIQPVSNLVANSSHIDVVFLPYYLFMHLWLTVSWSAWWMRLPSLLAGAAAVAALVVLAERWLPPLWSMLAGLLLALNPLFALWTIEARPYTAATLFAVLSTGSLVAAIERGSIASWVRYGLASLCLLLIHLIAVLVLVAQVAGVAFARRRSAWPDMAATLACVAVAASPLAVVAAGETRQVSWIPPPTLATFPGALLAVSGSDAQAALLVICSIIMLITVVSSPPGGDRTLSHALCLAWGAVPPLLLVLVRSCIPSIWPGTRWYPCQALP